MIVLKTVKRLFFVTLVTASLAINVIFLAWEAGAVALSAAWTAVTGTSAVVSNIVSNNKMLTNQNKAFQSKITSNKATAKRITKRVERRIAIGASRSATAVFAEFIPAVSGVVVFGVTAMELKEACETMKDLSELNALLEAEETGSDEGDVCGMQAPSYASLKETVMNSPQTAIDALRKLNLEMPSTSTLIESLRLSLFGKE